MKCLLLITLLIGLIPKVNSHPQYEGIYKQYGLKKYGNVKRKAITYSEKEALKALCKIGLNADGGIWSNDDINAAISSIRFGENWPDNASSTAYKTCNWGGYLK